MFLSSQVKNRLVEVERRTQLTQPQLSSLTQAINNIIAIIYHIREKQPNCQAHNGQRNYYGWFCPGRETLKDAGQVELCADIIVLAAARWSMLVQRRRAGGPKKSVGAYTTAHN